MRNTWLPYSILGILVLVIFATNYIPGTWLTGWDNLHPEFNFKTNIIDRSLFSVWQEYQGLGVQAGNAHAADLFRQLGLWLLSFFLSPNLLRYSYHFLALFVGAIGMCELMTRKLVKTAKPILGQLAGLLAGVFYVLNLGTVQNFYVPYEAFSHFYASLPWLLLGLFIYLDEPNRRNLLVFLIISLLAVPMNYIPTIFLVYLAICLIVLGFHTLKTKRWKSSIIVLTIIFCINAYWLLPFFAFVGKGTGFVSQTKINRFFTEEAFLRNQKFGSPADVAMLRGFLFDTTDLVDTQGTHDFIMKPWIRYLNNPIVQTGHSIVFVGIFTALIFAVLKRQPKSGSILALFALTLFALINDNPPTGALFSFLQTSVPLFKQVLRFPYTKFIVPAVLTYSIGFGYLIIFIFSVLKRTLNKPQATVIGIVAGSLTLLVFLNWPSFDGNFIYPAMRQEIPSEYFDLFQFFQKENPHGRIANLPQPTFWGWVAYDWGYRGSGFPWYGIRQPILDRAFDVWNLKNEQYYNELTTAIYTKNSPEALEQVFERYGISYLWLDERVILPHKPSLLFYPEIKSRVAQSARFTKVFASGKQTVYAFTPAQNTIGIALESHTKESLYPFSLTDPEKKIKIQETGETITVEAPIPSGSLMIPPLTQIKGPFLASLRQENQRISFVPIYPEIFINGKPITLPSVSFPITTGGLSIPIMQLNEQLISPSQTEPVVLYPKGNYLAIYPAIPSVKQNIGSVFFQKELRNCAEEITTIHTLFGRDNKPDILTLVGQQSHPCIYGKLSDVLTNLSSQTNGIVRVTLEHRSNDSSQPIVCLSKEGETSCLSQQLESPTQVTNGWKQSSYLVPVSHYPLRDLWLKLELAADSLGEKQISYRNLSVEFLTQPIAATQFNADTNQLPLEVPVTAGTLTLRFPKQTLKELIFNPARMQGEKRNCYALGKGIFERKIQTDPDGKTYVEYSAQNASSCDYFSFSNPLAQTGGIMFVESRNKQGRPIKACLKIDPPGYCLVEELLSQTTAQWKTVPLMFSSVQTSQTFQYFIELDNYAVGQEIRKNDVGEIRITPLPMDWLTSIQINPSGITQPQNPERNSTLTVSHPNPAFYKAILQTNERTLTLSQSYDPGWVAYTINTNKPMKTLLFETFPFLFGTKIQDHVLVNNWANGWVLPMNDERTNERTIFIVFWPQLLEFLGFALLPLPFFMSLRFQKQHLLQ